MKEIIKSLSGKNSVEKVKKDIDEIETINIELKHSVAKLLSENENLRKEREYLKSIYKDQFDSIGKTHVQSKEHCDSLIAQINAKSLENSNLNAQLQKKTCPNSPKPSEKLVAVIPINKDKRVRFTEPVTSSNDIPKQTDSLKTKDSNKPLLTFTGVNPTTSASRSKPSGNTKNNRITRPPRSNQKNKVEDHPRKVKSSLNKMNFVSELISNALVKHSVRNAKFESMCAICNKCLFNANHDMCLVDFVNDVNNPLIYGDPMLQMFHLLILLSMTGCLDRPLLSGLWMFKTYDRNRSQLMNFVSKFLGTVRFGNDQVAKIIGYGDYQQGNVIISKVYYIEALKHNLFSVGQFCDADLEAAFRKNTGFIRNLEGVDLLSGSRDTNLYTICHDDMLKTSSIYLLSKASKTKSWLWHRRLSHLNFDTLNKLAKDGLARVRLNATVRNVRTDNGTEFLNQTLRDFYENVSISHQTFVARTPQ
ncbi:integrase, catalytic region, zinc finger, CCHC-type containing protein [Tanacetum coccineum]